MDMKLIRAEIADANDHEITELVNALIERQKILHPDWAGMYISLPIKHPEECKRIVCCICKTLQKVWGSEMVKELEG